MSLVRRRAATRKVLAVADALPPATEREAEVDALLDGLIASMIGAMIWSKYAANPPRCTEIISSNRLITACLVGISFPFSNLVVDLMMTGVRPARSARGPAAGIFSKVGEVRPVPDKLEDVMARAKDPGFHKYGQNIS